MAFDQAFQAQFLTFVAGGERMALPASIVREVVPMPPLTRVPYAPQSLLGVANVRGRIVPVTSVAADFDMGEARRARVIVVENDGLVGLAVTSVSQLAGLDEAQAAALLDLDAIIGRATPDRIQRAAKSSAAAAPPAREKPDDVAHVVSFTISSQSFALPVTSVLEILSLPNEILILPGSPDQVLGSTGYHDGILPLLSMAALLGLPARQIDRRAQVIVVAIGSEKVGFVVERVDGLLSLPERDIDQVPAALIRGGAEARIQAICRLSEGTKLISVLAPEELLREDITARLMQGAATNRGASEQVEVQRAAAEKFLLFRTGTEQFAVPVVAVQQVAKLPGRLNRLAGAPDFVRGAMNVQGNLIPIIDLGLRFASNTEPAQRQQVLVLKFSDLVAGILVDAVTGIVDVPPDRTVEVPETGAKDAATFDRAITLEGSESSILAIDPHQLLDRAKRDLLASYSTRKDTVQSS